MKNNFNTMNSQINTKNTISIQHEEQFQYEVQPIHEPSTYWFQGSRPDCCSTETRFVDN